CLETFSDNSGKHIVSASFIVKLKGMPEIRTITLGRGVFQWGKNHFRVFYYNTFMLFFPQLPDDFSYFFSCSFQRNLIEQSYLGKTVFFQDLVPSVYWKRLTCIFLPNIENIKRYRFDTVNLF